MIGYYEITTKLKDALLAEPFCNDVTKGSIDRIGIGKQQIYPLSHIVINSATPEKNMIRWNVTIIAMDIVDISKTETTDNFIGNDNEDDILNEQSNLLFRINARLERGDLFSDKYQISGVATLEPFYDRFEDFVAGWVMTFDVVAPNDMSIC